MPPRTLFLGWALATLVGAALMALPDDNRRILSISRDHGPAALDFAGMLLVLAGFGAYVAGLVRARHRVARGDGAVALAAYVSGTALTGWSVATDTGWWWALGIAVALAGMGWLAWRVRE